MTQGGDQVYIGAPRIEETWDRMFDMPRNLVRYQQTGGDLHFITFSCYRRQAYLGTAEARDLFEKSLETMRILLLASSSRLM